MLAYLSHYTQRVAISNCRLIACPAAWVPPHPSLWAALRLRPQGQPRTRARTAERRSAGRRHSGRTS
uniref:hypothetical protein n=1 Tax=Mesorhizobium silamurunense TaxID=499528 RepID=UPI0035E423C7